MEDIKKNKIMKIQAISKKGVSVVFWPMENSLE